MILFCLRKTATHHERISAALDSGIDEIKSSSKLLNEIQKLIIALKNPVFLPSLFRTMAGQALFS